MSGKETLHEESFFRLEAIQIEGVAKFFGSVTALNGITTSVSRGEIRGLLGPNGSGKSTLMKILLGLVRPDRGNVRILGLNPESSPMEVRKMTGYVPETPNLYNFLTGTEYLDFVADLYSLPQEVKKERVEEFLTAFDLKSQANDLISGYSQGMRQKVAISAALLHKPKILILDEPLNGLDPRTARIVKDVLLKLAFEGVTILFSTHVLEIAEAICQRVTIINQGSLIIEGSVPELRATAGPQNSNLENIFLSLTGSSDVRAVVEELTH
jgi:ABC-2 type transport system ATP-binding protein